MQIQEARSVIYISGLASCMHGRSNTGSPHIPITRVNLVKLLLTMVSLCKSPPSHLKRSVDKKKSPHSMDDRPCLLKPKAKQFNCVYYLQTNMLSDICEELVIGSPERPLDPLYVQPASLEQATIRKKQGEELVSF